MIGVKLLEKNLKIVVVLYRKKIKEITKAKNIPVKYINFLFDPKNCKISFTSNTNRNNEAI